MKENMLGNLPKCILTSQLLVLQSRHGLKPQLLPAFDRSHALPMRLTAPLDGVQGLATQEASNQELQDSPPSSLNQDFRASLVQ